MLSAESLSSVNGKVAVLTGASRGLGKAIADKLIENGAKVVIGDILEKEGNETISEYNKKAGSKVAAFIRTDVTKYSDNIALFKLAEKEFGGVDIALLNAGIINNGDSMFTPLDDALEERMIDINTTAVIKGTKVALLHMAKRGGGVILHLASVAGLVSAPELSSYNASKFGVVGYTRSFGLMPTICNVRVNAICPYWVETDLISNISAKGKQDDLFTSFVRKSPRTSTATVVDCAMTLIVDETRNTQTLMALPDGLHVAEPFKLPFSDAFNSANVEGYQKYLPEAIPDAKARLAEALERYNFD